MWLPVVTFKPLDVQNLHTLDEDLWCENVGGVMATDIYEAAVTINNRI